MDHAKDSIPLTVTGFLAITPKCRRRTIRTLRKPVLAPRMMPPRQRRQDLRHTIISVRDSIIRTLIIICIARKTINKVRPRLIAIPKLSIRVRCRNIVALALEARICIFRQCSAQRMASENEFVAWISCNSRIQNALCRRLDRIERFQNASMNKTSSAVHAFDRRGHHDGRDVGHEVSETGSTGKGQNEFSSRVIAEKCHLGIGVCIRKALHDGACRWCLAWCLRVCCSVSAIEHESIVERR